MEAHATTAAELSFLYTQVEGVTSLVAKASDEAERARGLQHTRSKMFQDLEHRASGALSNLCDESVASPLVADDAVYLGFFTKIGYGAMIDSSAEDGATATSASFAAGTWRVQIICSGSAASQRPSGTTWHLGSTARHVNQQPGATATVH